MRVLVTNYYNASNRFSGPIRREPAPYVAPVEKIEPKQMPEPKECVHIPCKQAEKSSLIGGDGILLIGLLFLLLMSGCEDKWLLIALAYLLLF